MSLIEKVSITYDIPLLHFYLTIFLSLIYLNIAAVLPCKIEMVKFGHLKMIEVMIHCEDQLGAVHLT